MSRIKNYIFGDEQIADDIQEYNTYEEQNESISNDLRSSERTSPHRDSEKLQESTAGIPF
jgi:hypothetical protein